MVERVGGGSLAWTTVYHMAVSVLDLTLPVQRFAVILETKLSYNVEFGQLEII